MRIVSELVGGVVLLVIFFYGVNTIIKYVQQRKDKTDVKSGNEND